MQTVGNRVIAAIADGAGSAKHAEIGADLAISTILGEASRFEGPLTAISEDQAKAWLGAVRDAIAQNAETTASEFSDYATTLLLCIMEGSEAVFWQVGDGSWIADTGDSIVAATWPSSGEYVNETVFVTSDAAVEHLQFCHQPSVCAVAGFSDGLEHLLLSFTAKGPHVPLVGKILAFLKAKPADTHATAEIETFLNSDLVNERTDDDRTMVVAWRTDD